MPNNTGLSFEDSLLIVILSAVTLIDGAYFARTFRQRSVAAITARLERTIGLAMPDDLRPSIGRSIVRRQRIKYIGIFVTTAAMAVVAFTVNFPDNTYRNFLVVGSVLAGSVAGVAIGSLHWPARRERDSVRVAKTGAVSINDYIPPLESRSARILVVLALAIYLISILATMTGVASIGNPSPERTGAYFTGLAVLFLIFFEVVGRRIVAKAQPRGSERDLVWDDALRSIDVRALASTPLLIGLLGVLYGASDLGIGLHDYLTRTGLIIPITVAGWIVLAGMLFVAILMLTKSPERYFLYRLWPEYAAEPFRDPGAVVSSSLTAELTAERTKSRP